MKRVYTLFWLLLLPLTINSQEYFGEFASEPVFTVRTNEGRPIFVLTQDFEFKDPNGLNWSVPATTEIDGASIPKFAWSFVGGPMSGKYLHASIIHDHYCVTQDRTAHDTHRNFYYGMKSKGVPSGKAKLMYWAVNTFGPNWKLTKVPSENCIINSAGMEVCTSSISYQLTESPSIEVEWLTQETSDKIMEYATSLNKTLEDTDGQYFSEKFRENTPIGLREATLDELDKLSSEILNELDINDRE